MVKKLTMLLVLVMSGAIAMADGTQGWPIIPSGYTELADPEIIFGYYAGYGYEPENVFNDDDIFWHFEDYSGQPVLEWANGSGVDNVLGFDFGEPKTIAGFVYVQRSGSSCYINKADLIFSDTGDFSDRIQDTVTFNANVGYWVNTVVTFEPRIARYVKYDVNEIHTPGFLWNGASEMGFLTLIEPNIAYQETPVDGDTIGGLTPTLSWHLGRQAANVDGHRVYFSTEYYSVVTGSCGYLVRTEPNYSPGQLKLGTTYYWRVDEVNGVDIWPGNIWSFTTYNSQGVEFVESYNNDTDIQKVWKIKTGQSGLGGPYLEWTKVYSGLRSMKIENQNQTSPYRVEVAADVNDLLIDSPFGKRDFIAEGMKSLELLLLGDSENTNNRVYLTLTDDSTPPHSGTVICSNANVLKNTTWYTWRIRLDDPNFSSVNLHDVNQIVIGIGTGTSSGQTRADWLYVDAISLYGPRCLAEHVPIGDISGYDGQCDCRVDIWDLKVLANQWLSTVSGVAADLNNSGRVDFADFALLGESWSETILWP